MSDPNTELPTDGTLSDSAADETISDASPPNPFTDADISAETVTNDAVSGEPVVPTGQYAGPTGAEPLEAEPELADNDLAGDDIDLADSE